MPDGWKTPEGELYNVQEVYEDTIVLAYGDNGKTKAPKKPQACIWVNTHARGGFLRQPLVTTIQLCLQKNI